MSTVDRLQSLLVRVQRNRARGRVSQAPLSALDENGERISVDFAQPSLPPPALIEERISLVPEERLSLSDVERISLEPAVEALQASLAPDAEEVRVSFAPAAEEIRVSIAPAASMADDLRISIAPVEHVAASHVSDPAPYQSDPAAPDTLTGGVPSIQVDAPVSAPFFPGNSGQPATPTMLDLSVVVDNPAAQASFVPSIVVMPVTTAAHAQLPKASQFGPIASVEPEPYPGGRRDEDAVDVVLSRPPMDDEMRLPPSALPAPGHVRVEHETFDAAAPSQVPVVRVVSVVSATGAISLGRLLSRSLAARVR